ncbi:MAG: molybdopterin molybdotransferase MoeA [Clostridia bacterium]|nr:molybdopterin molybdotransferase MoeA [Clostridia bacterium]MBR2287901.1 molybdopterin molybdotransferase MoeA [Clostridia bacterium]
MHTPESALELLLQHVRPVKETMELPLSQSLGYVLAADLLAPISVPPFDRSPLDGYALHAADIADASRENPVMLRVIGEADAGCTEHFTVAPGQALRIMTGAPVPESCDCVIRQEDTDEGMEQAAFYASVKSGMNICRAGEDVREGTEVMQKGTRLSAYHLGVLSSLGFTRVPVYAKPKVLLLTTGDELTPPGHPLAYGKIYDSNQAMLYARLLELGADVIALDYIPDHPEDAAEKIRAHGDAADLIITTGGVSVGKKDIMHAVLPLLGATQLLWRIAMKPGSPLLCGLWNDRLLLCLSGNPYAAAAGFELFAKPVLRASAGDTETSNRKTRAVLDGSFPKASPQRRMIRGSYFGGAVAPTGANQTNGSLYAMLGCNCLIDLPAGSPPVQSGDEVEIILL